MEAIIGKKYQHYKNNETYIVLAIGHHSETLEELVIYEGQYHSKEFGHKPVWARPRTMFEDEVSYEGSTVPRFQCLDC